MPEDSKPQDLMRYDQMAQNALRGVVREALRKVQRSGLPGEHHFYIAFNTRFPGVELSERIASRYPREMTVVLQHQFWNLQITEEQFSVELSFDNIPEKLVIPFNSIKGFLDPSIQFGLQFETVPFEAAKEEPITPAVAADSQGKPADAAVVNAGAETKVVSLDAFRKK